VPPRRGQLREADQLRVDGRDRFGELLAVGVGGLALDCRLEISQRGRRLEEEIAGDSRVLAPIVAGRSELDEFTPGNVDCRRSVRAISSV